MASSLSADDITAPHAVGVLIALAADVSVCGAAYASVHRLWPLRGRAPTGSLLIDMPQLVLPGSLERWAICPMFAMAGDGALSTIGSDRSILPANAAKASVDPFGQKEGPAPVAVRDLLLCGLVAGVR